jgi:hypothetical protein
MTPSVMRTARAKRPILDGVRYLVIALFNGRYMLPVMENELYVNMPETRQCDTTRLAALGKLHTR